MHVRIIIYVVILFFLSGCSGHSPVAEEPKEFQLPDSLFVLKDVQNSLIANKFWYDENDNLCQDSSSKTPFVHLDSIQKAKWILPVDCFLKE